MAVERLVVVNVELIYDYTTREALICPYLLLHLTLVLFGQPRCLQNVFDGSKLTFVKFNILGEAHIDRLVDGALQVGKF